MGDEIKEKDSLLNQEATEAGKDMIEEAYAYEGIFFLALRLPFQ